MGIALVTGTSSGIGRGVALKLLKHGWIVYGLDIQEHSDGMDWPNYTHIVADVSDYSGLPDMDEFPSGITSVVNNAGVQNGHDIEVNLQGVINITKKYVLNNPHIRSVVNMASVSAHNGAEFGEYVASKGGVLSYTRWTAKQIAPRATCNSISFGGVFTPMNTPVMHDTEKWADIMSMTPMKKWCTVEEAADWVYMLLAINSSMTGQDIIVDNGEMMNHRFVW